MMMKALLFLIGLTIAVSQAGDKFAGKVVLVTGGSSGIGYATALRFAQEGARVVICARDSNPAWFNGSSAATNINADDVVRKSGGRARFVRADVTSFTDMKNLMNDILNNEKQLDIAVNNAGITGAFGRSEVSSQFFNTKYDAVKNNFYGTAISISVETDYWVKQNRNGIIVNVASVNGYRAAPGGAFYAASKHAIIGLTKSVALEFAKTTPKIRCNAIAPGFTDTSLVWNQAKYVDDGKTQPWEGEYITHDHPLWKKYGPSFVNTDGRIIQPVEQANLILYLASDEAESMVGATIALDGGLMA